MKSTTINLQGDNPSLSVSLSAEMSEYWRLSTTSQNISKGAKRRFEKKNHYALCTILHWVENLFKGNANKNNLMKVKRTWLGR